MQRMFSVTNSGLDVEEQLRLLEAKVQTHDVLLRNDKPVAVAGAGGKSEIHKKDEENSPQSWKNAARTVSFSDFNEDIPQESSLATPSAKDVESDEFDSHPRGLLNHSPSEQSILQEEVEDADYFKELSENTFTLMLLAEPFTKQWLYGVVIFFLQLVLLIMILVEMVSESKGSTPLDVTYKTDPVVQGGQLLAIIVSLTTQTDLVNSILKFIILWVRKRTFWTNLIQVPQNSWWWIWAKRIALPIACEFIEGSLVLCCTFVIVITTETVIDLFKDYAALYVISELDDLFFYLGLNGYAGEEIAYGAKKARKIKIHDRDNKKVCGIPVGTVILICMFFMMGGGWGYFVHGQVSGNFFELKYPHCEISGDKLSYLNIGDGRCEGRLNNKDCGFDGGDCITFNLGYPDCNNAEDPYKIGNGECDAEYNNKNCEEDGGDCCKFEPTKFLGDGICNGSAFNSKVCEYDRGDCEEFNEKYPKCEMLDHKYDIYKEFDFVNDEPPGLGDKKCNGGLFNTEKCGYDGGDCVQCNEAVPDPSKIGNGYCDGGIYMDLDDCNLDGGDCKTFKENFPRCFVPYPGEIGNGKCNGFPYLVIDCDNDGGDCARCNVPNRLHLGDGWCDGGDYMSEECGNDGGDCSKCHASPNTIGNGECDPSYNITECSWDGGDCLDGGRPVICNVTETERLGDGTCDFGQYNTEECSWDGGDCAEFNRNYQDCDVKNPESIGNDYCDGGEYNTEECSWDGGDCIRFNRDYPDCDVDLPWLLGNGICDEGEYNTEECGFDDGDCVGTKFKYPNCQAEFLSFVGDGFCDGSAYNTTECGFDGADCIGNNVTMWNTTIFLEEYQNCRPETYKYSSSIKDGVCDKEYNIEECAFDAGDCNDFNNEYPGCQAENPSSVGDGFCDGGDYNTPECGFDGGDCNDFNRKYPGCQTENPSAVGDGFCDGGDYNTKECRFDGGDCEAPGGGGGGLKPPKGPKVRRKRNRKRARRLVRRPLKITNFDKGYAKRGLV